MKQFQESLVRSLWSHDHVNPVEWFLHWHFPIITLIAKVSTIQKLGLSKCSKSNYMCVCVCVCVLSKIPQSWYMPNSPLSREPAGMNFHNQLIWEDRQLTSQASDQKLQRRAQGHGSRDAHHFAIRQPLQHAHARLGTVGSSDADLGFSVWMFIENGVVQILYITCHFSYLNKKDFGWNGIKFETNLKQTRERHLGLLPHKGSSKYITSHHLPSGNFNKQQTFSVPIPLYSRVVDDFPVRKWICLLSGNQTWRKSTTYRWLSHLKPPCIDIYSGLDDFPSYILPIRQPPPHFPLPGGSVTTARCERSSSWSSRDASLKTCGVVAAGLTPWIGWRIPPESLGKSRSFPAKMGMAYGILSDCPDCQLGAFWTWRKSWQDQCTCIHHIKYRKWLRWPSSHIFFLSSKLNDYT